MTEERDGYWLIFRAIAEAEARRLFVLRFGREPDECDWDCGCWWLGLVSVAEVKRTRAAGQMRLR